MNQPIEDKWKEEFEKNFGTPKWAKSSPITPPFEILMGEVKAFIENLLEQERKRMSDEVSFAAYSKVDKTDLFCHGFNKGIRVAISIINK